MMHYASMEKSLPVSGAGTVELRSKTRQERKINATNMKNMVQSNHVQANADTDKSISQDIFMRAKLGAANRSPDQDDKVSVPSDLSDDMWGEVPRY